MGRECRTHGDARTMSSYSVWQPQEHSHHGQPNRRWEHNIKPEVIDGLGLDWIQLDLDKEHWWALFNTVMNVWVLYKTRNIFGSWENISIGGYRICFMGLVSDMLRININISNEFRVTIKVIGCSVYTIRAFLSVAIKLYMLPIKVLLCSGRNETNVIVL